VTRTPSADKRNIVVDGIGGEALYQLCPGGHLIDWNLADLAV